MMFFGEDRSVGDPQEPVARFVHTSDTRFVTDAVVLIVEGFTRCPAIAFSR